MTSPLGFANHANMYFQIVRRQFVCTLILSPHFIESTTDTQTQLKNRATNAPLLRYVDSMRTHGHRSARIDPLDLIHREEEVAALSAVRYGLADEEKKYDVNGILWIKRVGAEVGEEEEWWRLREIREHLRTVYVGNIGYEVSERERESFIFLIRMLMFF
jgi:2-oxoglutarate dehydrogenase complex dehydrogenase (E1) component-like enzyme